MSLKDLANVVDEGQIESHSSSLTNTRLHFIEIRLDVARSRVREEPSIENIITFYGELENSFSYLQSLKQNETEQEKQDLLEKRITELQRLFNEFNSLWSYFKFRVADTIAKKYLAKYRDDALVVMQNRMIVLANIIADKLRVAYQSLSFYFRTGKRPIAAGIAGDLLNLRKNKKEVEHEE